MHPVPSQLGVVEPPLGTAFSADDWSQARRAAIRWVRRFPRLASHRDDLAQEASLGILRAHSRFDPERGVPFRAFAAWWAAHYVRRYVSRLLLGGLVRGTSPAPCGVRTPRTGSLDEAVEVASKESAAAVVEASLDAQRLVTRMLEDLAVGEYAAPTRRKRVYRRAQGAGPKRDVVAFVRVRLLEEPLSQAAGELGVSRERVRQLCERVEPRFARWRAALLAREGRFATPEAVSSPALLGAA